MVSPTPATVAAVAESLLRSDADGIATLTLNRPDKLNALNEQTIRELGQAMDEIASRDDVGGVILTGIGEKAFVAGADIAELEPHGALAAKAPAVRTTQCRPAATD